MRHAISISITTYSKLLIDHIAFNDIKLAYSNDSKEVLDMGKGDIRTRRGKLFRGTHGKRWPKKKKKKRIL